MLKPENVTALIARNEKMPFDVTPLGMAEATLSTADYSVRGLEDMVALERKSLDDLVACLGVDRDRFTRELQRMKAYPFRAVVVEAAWSELELGNYRSRISSKAACHSIISFQTRYCIPFMFAGSRESAQRYAVYFLYSAAKRVWERSQAFAAEVGN